MRKNAIPKFVNKLKTDYKINFEYQQPSNKRIYIRVPRENVRELAQIIFRDFEAKFSTATGIDVREGYEVLYHFTFDKEGFICTIRTLAPRDDPKLYSIVSIVPGATWIEREIHDILGVQFEGHPNLRRLVKAEFLDENEYPFRKDFDIKKFKEKHGLTTQITRTNDIENSSRK